MNEPRSTEIEAWATKALAEALAAQPFGAAAEKAARREIFFAASRLAACMGPASRLLPRQGGMTHAGHQMEAERRREAELDGDG